MLRTWDEGGVANWGSQVAAPESDAETKTEMPWDAAWEKRVSHSLTPELPVSISQEPKLMFIMGSLRVLTAYWAAERMPPPALLRTTRSTWAEGAVPRARVTSS